MRIVCLEQGDWVRPNHDPSSRRVWEPHRYGDFAAIPIRSDLPADYPINDDGSPIRIVNVNGVGGSTVMCMGHFPRLHPSDFKVRALDGVADDWPIDYDTLEPFYAENDRMMGVSGLAGDPAYPPKQPPMPLLPLGESGSRLAEAMNRLGWHWWPSDATIASTDIAYWPHAIRAGVELRTACRVREISLNEHGMASGVVYYDRDSNEHFQGAEIVVIACNGVGTPRLMLNSISGKFPNGIANSSGLVGKNLMLHPNGHAYGCVDDPMDNRGPPLCLTSQEFYETDPSRDFVRGYALQFGLGLPSILETIVLTANGRLPWGEDHHRLYRHMKGHRVGIAVICEDLPEEHNRVTLDPVLKDSNGIPAPKVDYTLGQNSRKMLAHGVACAKEILAAAGARDVACEVPLLNAGSNLLGTARMGPDPERSVVNEWGRCHDVKNLFIVDGSIWVTSGGVNPTSSIQALALYIADSIKQRRATLPRA
jgi:choline dehydrogenase-like flavoprotein